MRIRAALGPRSELVLDVIIVPSCSSIAAVATPDSSFLACAATVVLLYSVVRFACFRISAILFTSFLVETPDKMFMQLGVDGELKEYSSLKQNLSAGNKVTKLDPLFTRLDVNVEAEYIDNKMKEGKPY